MTPSQYITNLNTRYQLGNATEHTFRGDLQQLIESLVPDIQATNEPKRQKCGAPDYILTRKDIPVGFIEAKDIGDKDLMGDKKTGNKEQFDRYKASLPNLIFTDYMRFILYRNGECITEISIGELNNGAITPMIDNFTAFENLLREFATQVSQTITSPKKLAQMMAGKARLLSDVIEKSLTSDVESADNSTLKEQMDAFKSILIHDITAKGFADVYAQTICYGMFAARLHDPTLPTFSRQEAAELIPKTNPFLRKLFAYIAGPDLDDRIKWIVDSLVDIFLACNVADILQDFGKGTGQEDPIIHFYETFLAEYDPALRKARGVWYTPTPVVNFIVRAVDDILKTQFDLPKGLSDHSKTAVTLKGVTKDAKGKDIDQTIDVHRVQILDPATGTGTFLAEVIKHIHQPYQGQGGMWSQYVAEHLIPRLNGFELLMASYAMAHLKLDLLLTETGYVKPANTADQRLRVYLTNSLEEHHPDTGTLFANWLSSEANEANHIKRDAPVMVVMGNPPYSSISSNSGKWILDLIDDYKYIDGVHFNERKHWLNDDYVKFIRYGQHFIEKNGSGVLAYINPHGFLDNPTFRGMRWHLLKTFDTIYTIDLHGNAKKKEIAPDGSADQNVFDIMQGVSINFFVKTGKKKKDALGKVMHFDLFGKRNLKYQFLTEQSLKTTEFTELTPESPNYFFIPKNNEGMEAYEEGFAINDLFAKNVTGIVTMGDSFIVDEDLSALKSRLQYFLSETVTEEQLNYEFGLGKNYAKWILENKPSIHIDESKFIPFAYRPFDTRWTYFDNKLLWRWRFDINQHIVNRDNFGLVVGRQSTSDYWSNVQLTSEIIDNRYHFSYKGTASQFPLYLYPNADELSAQRIPNLNTKILIQIADGMGLIFTPEPDAAPDTFAPIDLLDYIYGVLHSPRYRETYKEFLKIDFPRVPYPTDAAVFRQWARAGAKLRGLHLLEDASLNTPITTYPIAGDHVVGKPRFELDDGDANNEGLGRVWINATQYVGNVPQVAWDFYIGGYQPAQKWLKDRKDRALNFDDLTHYQKIINAQSQTHALMQTLTDLAWD